MNPHYLGALEKGYNTPTLDTILLLARTLKVKASDLMLEREEASKDLQIVE
jgi:transcriptional regulator with XRE-family HTH domain